MKRLLKILLLILILIIPVSMGIIVVINFLYVGISNLDIFLNVEKLNDFGLVGDFFSGHINGFILLTLLISLYFQRTSISQTWKSIKQQAEANKTINEELQNSIKANMLLTKEFITTNYNNEFNEELRNIKALMDEMGIYTLCNNDFKVAHTLNNESLIELIKRKNYLDSRLIKIEDSDLKESLIHKINTSNINVYINKNEKLLKKVLVFNELLKVFEDYDYYLHNERKIKDKEEAQDFKNIYEFIMSTIDKKFLVEKNRFKLFEDIVSSSDVFDKNLKFSEQLLWNSIFDKELFYPFDEYYEIIVRDYELNI